jgi:hypothetical protein
MSENFSSRKKQIKLPIKKIIVEAFLIPWNKRKRLISALLIPSTVILTNNIVSRLIDQNYGFVLELPFLIIGIIFSSIFAITCHRLILLGDDSVSRFGIMRWSKRETRFLGWAIGLSMLTLLVVFMTGLLLLGFIKIGVEKSWNKILIYVFMILAGYIFARLSLLFPSTAIDQRNNISWAWNLSRANGWRLFLLVAVLPIIMALFQTFILHGAATFFETILVRVIGLILLPVEIAALSLSYKSLSMEVEEERFA